MAIRRRALLRGFTYVLAFCLTFGVPSAISLFAYNGIHFSVTINEFSSSLLTLNGALNVFIYMGWMWHTRRISARVATSGDIASLEQLIIDRYFDLELFEDEISHE